MAFIDLVNAEPVFSRFHKIKPNVNYRLWNPVSRKNDSLIQFDSRTNTVSCNGNFSQVSESKFTSFYISYVRAKFVAISGLRHR